MTKIKIGENVLQSLVMALLIIFCSMFLLMIAFIDPISTFIKVHAGGMRIVGIASFIPLYTLLFLFYHQMKTAAQRKEEIETITRHIDSDVLLVVGPERRISRCRGGIKEMYGYNPEDVIGQKTDMLYFDRRVNPDCPGEIREILERDGYHVGFAKGKKKSGDTIPLEIVTGNIQSREGVVLLIRDITKRKQIEDKLHESEERYEILFDGSKGAISVTVDEKIIDVNPAWLRMHGYVNKEDVHGMDLTDFVHADDRKRFIERTMNWEATQSGAYRMRHLHKDGREIFVELHSGIIQLNGKESIITTCRKLADSEIPDKFKKK